MAVLQTALIDAVGLLRGLIGVAEGEFAVLHEIAEIAEQFPVGLTLHGETATAEFTLTDSIEFLRAAVMEFEHLGKAAAPALLLLEVILHLVLLSCEDHDRISQPVGRKVALPVFHHTYQAVDGRQVLRVGHQQMDIVDHEQLTFHVVEPTLGEAVDPLVILRGIHLLETGIGKHAIGEEQLVDEIDDEGLTRTTIAEYKHVHLRALAHTSLLLRGIIESDKALHLIQDRLLTHGLGQEGVDINPWALCLLLWHSNRLNGGTDGYTFRLAGATDGTETGVISQFVLALDTSFHILILLVISV